MVSIHQKLANSIAKDLFQLWIVLLDALDIFVIQSQIGFHVLERVGRGNKFRALVYTTFRFSICKHIPIGSWFSAINGVGDNQPVKRDGSLPKG